MPISVYLNVMVTYVAEVWKIWIMPKKLVVSSVWEISSEGTDGFVVSKGRTYYLSILEYITLVPDQ